MKRRLLISFTIVFTCLIFSISSCKTGSDNEGGPDYVTVTFDDGTNITTVKIESGTKVTLPEDPVYEGRNFAGWLLNDDSFYKDTIITEDITLKAKWTIFVTFDSGDFEFSLYPDQEVITIEAGIYNSLKSDWYSLNNYKEEGVYYTFAGWSLKENGTEEDLCDPAAGLSVSCTLHPVFCVFDFNAVTDLTIEPEDSLVKLSWTSVKGYSSYLIEYGLSESTETSTKTVSSDDIDSKTMTAKVGWLLNNQEYSFKIYTIRSYESSVEKSEPAVATVTPAVQEIIHTDYLMLMYMDGDNNLNDMLYVDLNEVEAGLNEVSEADGSPSEGYKSINVIALWDGWAGDTSETPVLNHEASRILKLGSDVYNPGSDLSGLQTDSRYFNLYYFTEDLSYKAGDWIINSSGDQEVNMGDRETLVNFLKWAKERYSADKIVLQFSDHGGGVRSNIKETYKTPDGITHTMPGAGDRRSMAWDDGAGGESFLKTQDVAYAIKEADLQNIELIIEDVCLGGSIEEAYEFTGLANYYLASPNNVPGRGLDYAYFIKNLVKENTTTELTLKSVISDYKSDYKLTTAQWNEFISENKTILQNYYGINFDQLTVADAVNMSIKNENTCTLTAVNINRIADVKTALDTVADLIVNQGQTKTFYGVYYDTANGKFTTDVSGLEEGTYRNATYAEFLREYSARWHEGIVYMGNYVWMHDIGWMISDFAGISNSTLADYSTNKNAWTLLHYACVAVQTALERAIVDSWKDGYATGQLYYKTSLSTSLLSGKYYGLSITTGQVNYGVQGGSAVIQDETYPEWYETETAFGKDSSWNDLLKLWF